MVVKIQLLAVASLLVFSTATVAAPTVIGNTISWPDDGWYQVQDESTYESICGGGLSCDVEDGSYLVINHGTGERFSGIEVGGASTPIVVNGNTISWPDNGWYQVLNESDYSEACGGGSSCEVETGVYLVINHSTGSRYTNINVPNTTTGITVTGNTIFLPGDGWYQVQRRIAIRLFAKLSPNARLQMVVTSLSTTR